MEVVEALAEEEQTMVQTQVKQAGCNLHLNWAGLEVGPWEA